jgi:hypothetical protein
MRIQKVSKFRLMLTCSWLAFAFVASVVSAQAQRRVTSPGSQTEQARLRAQLADASREYKSSLEQLVTIYETDATRAEERLAKMKELCNQGLATRQDVETATETFQRAGEKLSEVKSQLKGADVELAEALIETKLEDAPLTVSPNRAPRTIGSFVRNTAYVRYGGGRPWSLSEAGTIKQFFVLRFGRALPIHVFGQSPLHDRWGYDHRNAMDIGLNPDSLEGQALMDYLRANGVPFTAFHFAIPGVATGPHIHVGLPSHRIPSMWAGAR